MSEKPRSNSEKAKMTRSWELFQIAAGGDEELHDRDRELRIEELRLREAFLRGRGVAVPVELAKERLALETAIEERRQVLVDVWNRSHDDPQEFAFTLRVEDLQRDAQRAAAVGTAAARAVLATELQAAREQLYDYQASRS